jgi:hypothetical protein
MIGILLSVTHRFGALAGPVQTGRWSWFGCRQSISYSSSLIRVVSTLVVLDKLVVRRPELVALDILSQMK